MGDLQVQRDGAFNTCYVDPGPFSKPGQTSAIAALTGGPADEGGGRRRRPGLRGRAGPQGAAGQKGKKGGTKEIADPFFCASTRTPGAPEIVGTGAGPLPQFYSVPSVTAPAEWQISMSEDFDWVGETTKTGPQTGITEDGIAGNENTFQYKGDRDAFVWVQVAVTASRRLTLFPIFNAENMQVAIGVGGGWATPSGVVPDTEAKSRQYVDIVVLNLNPAVTPYATQVVAECIVSVKKDQFITAAVSREVPIPGGFPAPNLQLQSAQITGTVIAYDD